MTDRPVRHVALELATKLRNLSEAIAQQVDFHVEGSTMPGRSIEPVSGGDPSDPTGRASERTDPVLAGAVPKLQAAISKANRASEYLAPTNPTPIDCKICGPNCPGECRAVHPRDNPRRCDSCYQHERRHNRDRTHQEIAEHRERMSARNADRAEQARKQRRAG